MDERPFTPFRENEKTQTKTTTHATLQLRHACEQLLCAFLQTRKKKDHRSNEKSLTTHQTTLTIGIFEEAKEKKKKVYNGVATNIAMVQIGYQHSQQL